jgi:hypothetical protein
MRRILTCGRAKDTSSPDRKDKPHTQSEKDDEEARSINSLDEAAAPYPVERVTDEEQARRELLESNISETRSHPNLSNN